jgi:hypothetical protein
MSRIDVMLTGIYRIKCEATGRYYIGTSHGVIKRIATHLAQLQSRRHPNKEMQNDWNEFGSSRFVFEHIEDIVDRDARYKRESEILRDPIIANFLYNPAKVKAVLPKAQKEIRCLPKTEKKSTRIPMSHASIPRSDYGKLLTLAESAKRKGMTLNLFKYHIVKPEAPMAIAVGKYPRPFWYAAHIDNWIPRSINQIPGRA